MAQTKVVITGAGGQLGQAFRFASRLADSNIEYFFFARSEMDLSRPDSLAYALSKIKPNWVINCAGYTHVEMAETETEEAFLLNEKAVMHLAEACRQAGARLIHFSTDYAFDGKKNLPYSESEITNPLSVYGQSKCGGERAIRKVGCDHYIFRTAWLFSPFGENFVTKMLRLGREKDVLHVVNDQTGSPTNATDLATMVLACISNDKGSGFQSGIFHLTNAGQATWFDLASAVLKEAGIPTPVMPVPTGYFPSKVERPAFSVLDNSLFINTFGIHPRPWQEALKDCIKLVLHPTAHDGK